MKNIEAFFFFFLPVVVKDKSDLEIEWFLGSFSVLGLKLHGVRGLMSYRTDIKGRKVSPSLSLTHSHTQTRRHTDRQTLSSASASASLLSVRSRSYGKTSQSYGPSY